MPMPGARAESVGLDAGQATEAVVRSYGAVAAAYAQGQGQLAATPSWQRQLLSRWAEQYDGNLLDLGCGPGHLTAYLAAQGRSIRGVDPVPELIAIARRNHPEVSFEIGDAASITGDELTGILAWYSLIHLHPGEMLQVLRDLRSHLRPGGGLLVSVFVGDAVQPLTHPVSPAWTWSPTRLTELMREAGFDVDDVVVDGSPRLGHGVVSASRS